MSTDTEPLHAASLAEAVAEADDAATLEDAVYAELVSLWDDLHRAIRDASGGGWSLGCGNAATRIAALTRASGRPVRWQDIHVDLLDTGIYEYLHDLVGVPCERYDREVVARWRAAYIRADALLERLEQISD